jgi:hypothetical protein
MIWTWLGALLVGVSLGLLGSGGSILTVPVLVFLAGEPEKLAITSSLAIVAAISAAGALPFARRRQIAWRSVILFGLPGMAGAALGAQVAHWLPAGMPLLIFAAVMFWAAAGMLRPAPAAAAAALPAQGVAPRWRLARDGGLIGVLTGIIGVGGGFLILPALVLLARHPLREAIGTSLAIIALNALVGFVSHLLADASQWRELDPLLMSVFIVVGIAGSLAGQSIGGRLPQRGLRRLFGVVLIAIAAFILWQQLPALLQALQGSGSTAATR